MSHMESSLKNIFVDGRWKKAKQTSFQDKLLRHLSSTRFTLWRKHTYLYGLLHPLTSGRVEPLDMFTWTFWFECLSIPLLDEEEHVYISWFHSQRSF